MAIPIEMARRRENETFRANRLDRIIRKGLVNVFQVTGGGTYTGRLDIHPIPKSLKSRVMTIFNDELVVSHLPQHKVGHCLR